MKTRKEILTDLVFLRSDIKDLEKELSAYPWDCETPIIIFKKEDLRQVLEKFLFDKELHPQIEDWANVVECRDDIEFENEILKEYIYELANPFLTGENSKSKIINIVKQLQAQSPE